VDIDQLQTFAEVARRGSVTAAAQALGLQQPTASHRLAALERRIGTPLFERLGTGLALTAAGRALLPYATSLPAAAADAVRAARVAAGLSASRLHIGCAETPATYLLPDVLRRLRQNHPALEVRLTVGNAARILAVTLDGEVDVAVLTSRERRPNLQSETIRHDRFVVVVAADDPWAPADAPVAGSTSPRRIPVWELATRRLLLRESGAGTRAFVDAMLKAAGVQAGETLEVASLEALKRMAEAGVGVAVVPLLAVEREAREGRLLVLDLAVDSAANTLDYCLVRHKDKLPVPGVDLFRAALTHRSY